MIGFYGTKLPGDVRAFIEENNIGFVILFSRNIESAAQVLELTADIHAIGASPPLIYTDQEGGAIVRFNEMAATVVSAMGIAAGSVLSGAETAGRIIGEDMSICGIDGVFAPVLDVNVEEDNPVIGIRSFSDQPEQVTAYAKKFYRGLKSGGVLACGKHYPGHGAAAADSHLEIPEINVSYEYFRHYCFKPFETLAKKKIDSLMTAHLLFPQIAPDIATFSPYMIRELLRKETGYNGVVFSDCLEMKAVKENYSPEDIVNKAIHAGIDVMVPSHTLDFQKELLDVLLFNVKKGIIKEERIAQSAARIAALKKKAKGFAAAARGRKNLENKNTQLRKSIAIERQIADRSMTLLRNRTGILPIEKNKKTLLLEWAKSVKGPSIAEKEGRSLIGRISADYFDNENRDLLVLKPGEPLPDGLGTKLKDYAYIVVFIYSRTGTIERCQTEAVKKLLELRADAVIVSLENPYEIKKFPLVDTFLVTYGFRKVQLEALFKVLTGAIAPSGKLPVEIKGLFPRGFGLV